MPRADIAILTVIPEEYGAVLASLAAKGCKTGYDDPPSSITNLYGWVSGALRDARGKVYQIVVGMVGLPGPGRMASAVSATLARYRPRYILLVGIAGGFHEDGLAKGDVAISTVIYEYEYGKVTADFQPRQNFTYQVDTALLTSAISLHARDASWASRDQQSRPDEYAWVPKLLSGAVASGSKIIDNIQNAFFAQVLKLWPGLLAVEMEGAGAGSAIETAKATNANVGFIMIRGISDMPQIGGEEQGKEGNKTERNKWKLYAATTAANFTIHWISQAWPTPPRRSRRTTATSPPQDTDDDSSPLDDMRNSLDERARVGVPLKHLSQRDVSQPAQPLMSDSSELTSINKQPLRDAEIQSRPVSSNQLLADRQHALAFQKMLESWRQLRKSSRTSIHILSRYEPADTQTHQARTIITAMQEHGRPTARYVADKIGAPASLAVLQWVDSQLAASFSLDNASAAKFPEISQIVENALLQPTATDATNPTPMGTMVLTLSGGGLRATLFHLGIFVYLAQTNRLSRVTGIVSVSGGSILAAHFVKGWQEATKDLASFTAVAASLVRFARSDLRHSVLIPWLWSRLLPCWGVRALGRTARLEQAYRKHFGMTTIAELAHFGTPELALVASDGMRQQRVAFSYDRVRRFPIITLHSLFTDSGELRYPDILTKGAKLSLAVAASSCYPPLFPRMRLSHADLGVRYDEFQDVLLVNDGGVTDNLGIEVLLGMQSRGRLNAEMTLICDAERSPVRTPGGFRTDLDAQALALSHTAKRLIESKLQEKCIFIGLAERTSGSSGLSYRAQTHLAGFRTDLDAPSWQEIHALLLHGAAVAAKNIDGSETEVKTQEKVVVSQFDR